MTACEHNRVDRFSAPGEKESTWKCASCGDQFILASEYNELAKRTNVLERRMGQIAMVLRDDIEEKPIRDF